MQYFNDLLDRMIQLFHPNVIYVHDSRFLRKGVMNVESIFIPLIFQISYHKKCVAYRLPSLLKGLRPMPKPMQALIHHPVRVIHSDLNLWKVLGFRVKIFQFQIQEPKMMKSMHVSQYRYFVLKFNYYFKCPIRLPFSTFLI